MLVWVVLLFSGVLGASSDTHSEMPPGTTSLTLPSGTVVYSSGETTVSLTATTLDPGDITAPDASFVITELIASSSVIVFKPPHTCCFAQCFEYNAVTGTVGAACEMTRVSSRDLRCSCQTQIVTYQYQGKVCEPAKSVAFLAAAIVYGFTLLYVVDNVCRLSKKHALFLVVIVICCFRLALCIARLPNVPYLNEAGRVCLVVIPDMLQYIALRLLFSSKWSAPFFNFLTCLMIGFCAVSFAAVAVGSYLSEAPVNITLGVLEGIAGVLVAVVAMMRLRMLFRPEVGDQKLRVLVILGIFFALMVKSLTLACGFYVDEWLFASAFVFIVFDVIFLELVLFYAYHFEVLHRRRVVPQTLPQLVELSNVNP